MKRYKAIAEEAEAKGYKVTAGNNFLRASLLAHSGQMCFPPRSVLVLVICPSHPYQCERCCPDRRAARDIHVQFDAHIQANPNSGQRSIPRCGTVRLRRQQSALYRTQRAMATAVSAALRGKPDRSAKA